MEIPLSVWDEIPVTIIFTLLLVFLGKKILDEFSKVVSKIEESHLREITILNEHYVRIINVFDRRWEEQSKQINKVNDAIVKKLEILSETIDQINNSVIGMHTRYGEYDGTDRRRSPSNAQEAQGHNPVIPRTAE